MNLGIPSRVKGSKEILKAELLSYNQEMSPEPVNWETHHNKMGIYAVLRFQGPGNAPHHEECQLPCLTEQLAGDLKLQCETKPQN